MKKIFSIVAMLAFAAAFTSCEKEPEGQKPGEEKLPTVTVSADATFNDANEAKLTVTLSAAATKDVVVKLAKDEPQTGKTKMDATFDKSVTIPAGETSKEITVKADTRGLEPGEYQAAIKITSAEGAEVGTTAVAYINFTYVFKPTVNLYADASFGADGTAKVKVVLSDAISADVTVTLELGAESTITPDFEKTVVIPAGQTEKEIVLTVNTDGLANGQYNAIINVVSVGDNAVVGNAKSVSTGLTYPFSFTMVIDGDCSEWQAAGIPTWTCPESAGYDLLKVMKMTADSKYVYIYFEQEDAVDHEHKVSFYFNLDGDIATGGYVGLIDAAGVAPYATDNQGLDGYCDLWWHESQGVYNKLYCWGSWYKWNPDSANGAEIWGNLIDITSFTDYTSADMFCMGTIADGIGYVEMQFSRKFWGITGDKFAFAAKFMPSTDANSVTGLLPQGEWTDKNDPATRQLCDMAFINLPPYQE